MLNAFEFAFQIIHQKWNRFEWSTIANGSLNALVKNPNGKTKKSSNNNEYFFSDFAPQITRSLSSSQ